jgi:hypothetical protein
MTFNLAIIIVCGIVMVRNNIVFRRGNLALTITSHLALKAIEKHEFDLSKEIWQAFEKGESVSWGGRIFDLTKWSMQDFYPDLMKGLPNWKKVLF